MIRPATGLRTASGTPLTGLVFLLYWAAPACGQIAETGPIDLGNAQIVTPNNLSVPEHNAVDTLVDEIAARTRLRLPVAPDWPRDDHAPVIVVGRASTLQQFAGRFADDLSADSDQLPPEGFRIRTYAADGPATIVVAGNDARGVLYGVGKLLRSLEMTRDRVVLPGPLNVTTAPAMPIRGHQLGFRPKTNSYDAWDLPQWEQYIRDLSVFGCNAIELIPPRSDDDADSPHFPRPQMEMMIGMSQLAADYGMDVWIWYPAMELSYPDDESIQAAVEEWGEVLAQLPRVNALFVPSGDPGDAPPHELMAMLAAQAPQLKRLHPDVQLWISMQGFTPVQFDDMLAILTREPDWLAGIVHGPQTRVSVAKLRELLPRRYAIRGYPDITHSMRCEYPVPDWDLAYVLTEGSEDINPRPQDETTIFRQYRSQTSGVITYSEGCNDDVNKAVWSALCWDPETQPATTLAEYSRYFIGDKLADDFAQGLSALEQNWRGPLLANEGVTATLERFRAMEKSASPRTLRNWRFQQALYRAYYDAYQRARLIEESASETAALAILAKARETGSSRALDDAEQALDLIQNGELLDQLSDRVRELAEALFQSIGMQLSVDGYRAIEVGRGANLDELDVPLNNQVWLKRQFAVLRSLDNEEDRLQGIHAVVHWTDPGPGGFYDDLGNQALQPHLVRDPAAYSADPGFLASPTIGFRSELAWRRSWCTHVDGLYGTPVTMHYADVDPHGRYKLRVVYAGESFDVKVRLVAALPEISRGDRTIEVHPFISKPQPVQPVEFDIPQEATSIGELTLTWQANPERGGPGRGCQIAEVWLIKLAAE
jgi:hypothetical protein